MLSVTIGAICSSAALAQESAQASEQESAQASAQEPAKKSAEPTRSSDPADGARTVLVVIGAGGTDQYQQMFHEWADTLQQGISQGERVRYLEIGRDASPSQTDKQGLQDHIAQWKTSENANRSPQWWIVLIGHGTFERNVAKFNLRGPDVSAQELADWVDGLPGSLVVVNVASCSEPFLKRLSAPGRVLVSATKSGNEHNFARFGKYFAQAITAPEADRDHDDEVSLTEAFLYASESVAKSYEQQGRIATEHALLDDNHDQKGSSAEQVAQHTQAASRTESSGDGLIADRIVAYRQTTAPTLTPEQRDQQNQWLEKIDQLRSKKSQLDEDQYYSQLETLLLELAKVTPM